MPDPTKPEQPQELETARSEKFFKTYANAANLEMTPWDFTLLVGELRKAGDKVVIDQSVAITMSPQHAKALAGVLVHHVKEYEKQVGEIRMPQQPEAQAPAETQPKAPTAVAGFKTN
jgi:hypothetical protein